MKREMDLIRALLLKIEEHPKGFAPDDLSIDGYTPEQVAYHKYLLVDGGLAEGMDTTTMDSEGPEAEISHLTYAGHEFADAIRNDTVWRKVKAKATEVAGTVPIQVLSALAIKYAKDLFGLAS